MAIEHHIGLVADRRHAGILVDIAATIAALARIITVDKPTAGEAEPLAGDHRILEDQVAGLAPEGKQGIETGAPLQKMATAIERQGVSHRLRRFVDLIVAAILYPVTPIGYGPDQRGPLAAWRLLKGGPQGSVTLVHPLFGTELGINLLVKIAAEPGLYLVVLDAGQHQQAREQAEHQHYQQHDPPLSLQSLVHPAPPAA